MTPETITIDSMEKLENLLNAMAKRAFLLRVHAEKGNITPQDAADEIKDMAAEINRACTGETELANPLHAIREEMTLRGGSFVAALSTAMGVADDDNIDRILRAFPEILERYDALATLSANAQPELEVAL